MLYKIFKFYLKKIDPELAHKLAIVLIKILALLPRIFSPKIEKNLHTNVFLFHCGKVRMHLEL